MKKNKDLNNFDSEYVPILNPCYITGFVDGEGCWVLSINKDKDSTIGYVVTVSFELTLYVMDLHILKGFLHYFGVGNIYKHGINMMRYKVSSIKNLITHIIPHFDKYSLLTDKRNDFELLKKAIFILNKGPLTKIDLEKIVCIKASLDRGLSSNLKLLFPKIIPIKRLYKYSETKPCCIDPFWILGFTEAKGHFYKSVYIKRNKHFVRLRFIITQHIRDKILLENFIYFFNCGNYSIRKNELAGEFKVSNITDIDNIIIPFFNKYPLISYKSRNFYFFCLVTKIIKEKKLNKEAINEIKNIIDKEYKIKFFLFFNESWLT